MENMYIPYAGVGSRETPDNVLVQMTKIATFLENKGFTLRSGGAPAADDAFEKGVHIIHGKKEIFLPWYKFNGRVKGIIMEPTKISNYTDHKEIFPSRME